MAEETIKAPNSYEDDFYNSDAVKELGINKGDEISEEQKKKLENLYTEYNNAQTKPKESEDQNSQEGDAKQEDQNSQEEDAKQEDKQDINTEGFELVDAEETAELEWVEKYNKILTQEGEKNNNKWSRDPENTEGLRGNFANGTEVHYTSAHHVSVKVSDETGPKAEHFKEIVALAKENKQKIKLGDSMNPEYRKALIEACALGSLEIVNMNEEEQSLYSSFIAGKEKTEEKQEEREEYKLNPLTTKGFLESFNSSYLQNKDSFNQETEKRETELSESKNFTEVKKARLLLRKYVIAEKKNDNDSKKLYAKALQYYGLDTISQDTDGRSYVVTTKDYKDRTPEEQTEIKEAMDKVFANKKDNSEQKGRGSDRRDRQDNSR